MKLPHPFFAALAGLVAATALSPPVAHAVGDPIVTYGAVDTFTGGDTISGWACRQGGTVTPSLQVYAGDPTTGGTPIADGNIDPVALAPGFTCTATSAAPRFTITIPQNLTSLYQGQPIYVTAAGVAPSLAGSGSFTLAAVAGNTWSLDDGAGTSAQARINWGAQASAGALVNAPVWAPADQCHLNGCLSFPDNKTQRARVEVPLSNKLKFGTGDFTVSTWIKTTAGTGENAIVSTREAFAAGWVLSVYNHKAAFGTLGPGGSQVYILSDLNVDDGAWHQIVGRRMGDAMSLIVDGGLAATWPLGAGYNSDSGVANLTIGDSITQLGSEFVGSIDEVSILPRAMTDDELGLTMPAHLSNIQFATSQRFLTTEATSENRIIVRSGNITTVGEAQTFQLHDLGGGIVALRTSSQRFLKVVQTTLRAVTAGAPGALTTAEKYRWIDLGKNKLALRSVSNDKYVGLRTSYCVAAVGVVCPPSHLTAESDTIENAQTFQWQRALLPSNVAASPISMQVVGTPRYAATMKGAASTAMWTCADAEGACSLLDSAMKFQVVDLGKGLVALKALGTGLFVSVYTGSPASPLFPNAENIGQNETFEWIYLGGDGTITGNVHYALRSVATGRFVRAQPAGILRIEAVGTTIGPNETFAWASRAEAANPVSGGGYSFVWDRTYGNGEAGVDMWILGAATGKQGLAGLLGSVAPNSTAGKALARLPLAVGDDFAEIIGDAGFNIKLLGSTLPIVEVGGYVGYNNGPVNRGQLRVGGNTMVDVNLPCSPLSQFVGYQMNKQFSIKGIPIVVTGSVGGTVSMSCTTTAGSVQNPIVITPGAVFNVAFSAGVGSSFASYGIYGNAEILNTTAPLSVGYDVSSREYRVGAAIDTKSVHVDFGLYAELDLLFYKRRYELELAAWDGPSYNASIFDSGIIPGLPSGQIYHRYLF